MKITLYLSTKCYPASGVTRQALVAPRKYQYKEQIVRTFPIIETPRRQKNINLGSSIIKKLETDKIIPTDFTVHAYRGSIIEKLKLLKKYPKTKMKTVILQGGTNSFLKFERKPRDVFGQYKKLVKLCGEKFNPEKFYLMTVIPMKNASANMAKNGMYDEFNDLIKTYYENDPDNNILDFYKLIKEIGAKTNNIGLDMDLKDCENSENNQLYHDNVHLIYRSGIPFLKNHLMRILLDTSGDLISKTQETHPSYANTNNTFISNTSSYENMSSRNPLIKREYSNTSCAYPYNNNAFYR